MDNKAEFVRQIMLKNQQQKQEPVIFTSKHFMINGHPVEIITRNKQIYRVVHKFEKSCYVEHYEKGKIIAVYSHSCPWNLLAK